MKWMCWLAAAALLPVAGCGGGGNIEAPRGTLDIYFMDVGEGDAVLLRLPDGRAVVYDGGKDRRALLAAMQALGVDSLTLIVASHSHSDHVGGLARVIEWYAPRYVLSNGLPHYTRRYQEFAEAVDASDAELLEPRRQSLLLGDVVLQVVPPPSFAEWGHNDSSIGMIVEFGAFRASFLGDAEPALQAWWLDHHQDLLGSVSVHKASHHGSRKGDTPSMINQLNPAVVVVGTVAGSQYPHADVVEMYERHGAVVLRTDRNGTVRIQASASGAFQVLPQRCDSRIATLQGATIDPSPLLLADRAPPAVVCP
jgi:competence protein ComEC